MIGGDSGPNDIFVKYCEVEAWRSVFTNVRIKITIPWSIPLFFPNCITFPPCTLFITCTITVIILNST